MLLYNVYETLLKIDGDGRLDIDAPGKYGLVLFRNLGFAEGMGE